MGAELSPLIAAALSRGATVLTPGRRSMRALHDAYDRTRQAAGETLWQPASILSLDSWLKSLHHQLAVGGHEARVLMNRVQQHALWRSTIAQDLVQGTQAAAPDTSLRPLDSLAELAAHAARLLHLYQGSANPRDFAFAADTRAFERWLQAFARTCRRDSLITEAELPDTLLKALAAGTLELPSAGVALVDFGPLPPAVALLFDSLELAGYAAERIETGTEAASAELHAAPDDAAELLAAARWVKAQLEASPSVTVAVVVPNLEERRAAIERIFAPVLAPDAQPINATAAPPYEFSLGVALDHSAPIAAALPLLRWPVEPLPLTVISQLLLSPAFAASQGPASPATLAAAEFDAARLRRARLLNPELSLEALSALLGGSSYAGSLGPLRAALARLARAEAAAPVRQPYAGWADHFRVLLEAAGWTTGEDSLAFQLRSRWESGLDELATLDLTGPVPTRVEALAALTRLARETIFALESRRAPVQILGPLELGGVAFDALWFLGADDLAWPPPASPNPLLPFELQHALGMPATDAARDRERAGALTARIAHSARHVVFSYAAAGEQGTRRPSATLEPLALSPFHPGQGALPPPPLPMLAFTDTELLPALPDRVIPGGARILELQAACPFRAFAELRLDTRELTTREPGLDPRERGEIVHTVLEAFWLNAASQSNLRLMSGVTRGALLDRCIDAALADTAETARRAREPWDAAYVEVQRLRLQQLLRPWLALELDRPPFTVTDQERTLDDFRLGPLRLSLRVDRIDETAGGTLILDYKTGAATPADWLSDRPEAPQLPLYAVAAAAYGRAEDLGGVAFANLRAGEDLALKGFADSLAVLAKPARNMESATLAGQVEQWREHLTALAEAFAGGDVRVCPKSYPHTCQRCSQRMLCRLDPTTLSDFDEDDESDAPAGWGAPDA